MMYNLFDNRDFVSVFAVALLAEGVDRNLLMKTLSSVSLVALLAEGVDRNIEEQLNGIESFGRPPRGGRG